MLPLRLLLSSLASFGLACVQPPANGGQEGEPLRDSGGAEPAALFGSVTDETTAGVPEGDLIVIELRDHAATLGGWPDPERQPIQSLEVPWEGQATTWSTQLDAEDDTVEGVLIFALWDDGTGDLYDGPRGRYSDDPLPLREGEVYGGLHVVLTDDGRR